jgi:hypothetical protein
MDVPAPNLLSRRELPLVNEVFDKLDRSVACIRRPRTHDIQNIQLADARAAHRALHADGRHNHAHGSDRVPHRRSPSGEKSKPIRHM